MADTTSPRFNCYQPGPGPYITVQNDSNTDICPVGTVASLSGGKCVQAAADAIQVFVVKEIFQDAAGDYYSVLDGSGAILEVVFTTAQAVGTKVKMSDNQTVLTTSDPTKDCGMVVKVVSTNVARVLFREAASAAYAS